MPSVTRRNQVLRELDRIAGEFNGYNRKVAKGTVNLPSVAMQLLEGYPKLPEHITRGLKEFFTTVPSPIRVEKPSFHQALNELRDKATLAETEQDIKDIFHDVDILRSDLITWRNADA